MGLYPDVESDGKTYTSKGELVGNERLSMLLYEQICPKIDINTRIGPARAMVSTPLLTKNDEGDSPQC